MPVIQLHRSTVYQEWPETIPVEQRGSVDPLGDDYSERSGWGALNECAVEGGHYIAPAITIYSKPTMWQRFCRWVSTT